MRVGAISAKCSRILPLMGTQRSQNANAPNFWSVSVPKRNATQRSTFSKPTLFAKERFGAFRKFCKITYRRNLKSLKKYIKFFPKLSKFYRQNHIKWFKGRYGIFRRNFRVIFSFISCHFYDFQKLYRNAPNLWNALFVETQRYATLRKIKTRNATQRSMKGWSVPNSGMNI